jgi:hypothetical protein
MAPNKTWLGWLGIVLAAGSVRAQLMVVQPLWMPVAPAPVVRYYLPATSRDGVQYYVAAAPTPGVPYYVPAAPTPNMQYYVAPSAAPQRIERYYFLGSQSDEIRTYLPPKDETPADSVRGGVIIREYYYPAAVLLPSPTQAAPAEKSPEKPTEKPAETPTERAGKKPAEPPAPSKLKMPTPEEAIGPKAKVAEKDDTKSKNTKP